MSDTRNTVQNCTHALFHRAERASRNRVSYPTDKWAFIVAMIICNVRSPCCILRFKRTLGARACFPQTSSQRRACRGEGGGPCRVLLPIFQVREFSRLGKGAQSIQTNS